MENKQDKDESFVHLMVAHQVTLQAYVLGLLPGHQEVDDLIQEVNALLWQKRNEFEPGTNFKAWMFSVARYKVMALRRDEKRRKVWAMPDETLHLLMDEAVEVFFEADDPRHLALRECIRDLSPPDRGLILRRYLEDYSLKQLGREVGRKAVNLKGSLHRIRIALRGCVRRKIKIRGVMS